MTSARTGSMRRHVAMLLSAALVASAALTAIGVSPAAAATDLWICARPGAASIADPATAGSGTVSINFTGFVQVSAPADCATTVPRLSDPTPVRLTQGVTYNLNVVNQAGFSVNLSAVGLTGAPDLVGIAPTATGTYSITPAEPGTYLFESSLDPRHTLLGLHGVIVVDPAVADGTAHGTLVSAYDSEQLVVLSEVDTSLNNAVDPFAVDILTYSPDLFLINGQTWTVNSPIPPILANNGERLLLRYVNASASNETMTILGLRQRIVAFDGEIHQGTGALGEIPEDVSNVALSAGQTADVVVTVAGAAGTQIPIYNRNLRTSAVDDNGQQLMMISLGTGPVAPTTNIYLSLNNTLRSIAGVNFRDEDVAMWDGSTATMAFEGAAHGLIDTVTDFADIDAVDVDSVTGDIWFSLRQDFPKPTAAPFASEWAGVPDLTLRQNDVFKYDFALNTFTVWLDGSVLGLADGNNRHDINGIDIDPLTGTTNFTINGSILMIDAIPLMTGSAMTFGAANEDVISRTPALGAADPSGPGAFQIVADNSDLGLAGENLDGLVLIGADVLMSITTEYPNGPTPQFDRNDLFACLGHQLPPSGSITDTCTAPLTLKFDADVLHAGNLGQVDAYSLG